MTNKNNVGELIIEHYNRKRGSDITVNLKNNDVTFRDFLKMDFQEETITFTEQELEAAILFNCQIRSKEIINLFSITQLEFEHIFKSLKHKISAPNFCSKKYIANRMCKIFPNEICYKILDKYNLTEISIKRHGINPENKYNQNEYEKIKANITSRKTNNVYYQKQEVLFSILLEEILKLISSKISQEQLTKIIDNIKISKNN